mmetsp:Transcript_74138/g.130859  ORF Transcript_74138/g.130859 Transcript_74138/m.130859 type:complete len:205 (-) Transcript_74138:1824-2438(-)
MYALPCAHAMCSMLWPKGAHSTARPRDRRDRVFRSACLYRGLPTEVCTFPQIFRVWAGLREPCKHWTWAQWVSTVLVPPLAWTSSGGKIDRKLSGATCKGVAYSSIASHWATSLGIADCSRWRMRVHSPVSPRVWPVACASAWIQVRQYAAPSTARCWVFGVVGSGRSSAAVLSTQQQLDVGIGNTEGSMKNACTKRSTSPLGW